MIPSRSFLGFKRVDKEAWFALKTAELETIYREELKELKEKQEASILTEKTKLLELEKAVKKLELSQFDVDELTKRVDDKKIELMKGNKDLADQIRVLEAKSSPDQIWSGAFNSGFSKAWDMMIPVIYDGFNKVKQEISDNAKMETLNGLQSVLGGKNGTNSAEN